MPMLIVQQGDLIEAGVIAGPLLIGRVRACGVVVDSNDVSRVHAWIGEVGGRSHFVADTFSREGTRVNGKLIASRHRLVDGDVITIGSARMIYQVADKPHAGATPLDLGAKVWKGDEPDVPIRFVCSCGATIAVSSFFAGRTANCAYCDARLVVPRSSGQVAGGSNEIEPCRNDCSICQCGISSSDAQTTCPGCGLSFHTDCWTENRGCSAYGCGQVNVLDVSNRDDAPATGEGDPSEADLSNSEAGHSIPWGYLAMGAATVVLAAAGTVGYWLYIR